MNQSDSIETYTGKKYFHADTIHETLTSGTNAKLSSRGDLTSIWENDTTNR